VKPRVLVIADVPGWAWDRKARAYATWLGGDYAVEVAYQRDGLPALDAFDLVHCFEFPQVNLIPATHRGSGQKLVTGLTANVWRTWGRDKVRAWALRADGVHANSVLLADDLRSAVLDELGDPTVFYCPNGVDERFWHRYGPRPDRLIAGHVGKPNPRKGADVIAEACRRTGVMLKLVQRVSRLALSAVDMRAWYQGVSVQVTASNMDGTPNPMLESAACGNALLSTPIGNMPQFMGDYPEGAPLPGLLVPPLVAPLQAEEGYTARRQIEDNAALLSALEMKLAWMRDDYAKVRAMGEVARARVEDAWTWRRQVEHVDRMWATVLGDKR
jgi:glycosyltransferase involved in cell wall biosynthesis